MQFGGVISPLYGAGSHFGGVVSQNELFFELVSEWLHLIVYESVAEFLEANRGVSPG